jgi:UDPglucose 6-dehydrogenase
MPSESKKSILVVGAGFVGLSTAVFLAHKKLQVHVVEKSQNILRSLKKGKLHFHEPTLSEEMKKVIQAGLLTFGSPSQPAYQDRDFIIIAIDSVDVTSWKMRLGSFQRMVRWIAGNRHKTKPTIVLKSTNILGFSQSLRGLIDAQPYGESVRLVVNPEFLREGFAYEDTAQPSRLVIGSDDRGGAATLVRLYRSLYARSIPFVVTDCRSAELIKLSSNLYLSHRLTFIHEVAEYARLHGLNIEDIRDGIGLDPRIGREYFEPGLGFGGSCLPKDCHLINSREARSSFVFATAETALSVNDRVLHNLIGALSDKLGKLSGKKIAIFGVAFKPELDDIRGSQAVQLARKLRRRGAKVRLYEPFLPSTTRISDGKFELTASPGEAVQSASALIIGTAHRRFRRLSPKAVGAKMSRRIVVDYHRLLNRSNWEREGFEFL